MGRGKRAVADHLTKDEGFISHLRSKNKEDIAEELTVGYVGSMTSEYIDNGIPFLRSLNIEPFGINKKDLKYISKGFHEKIRKSKQKGYN